MSEAVYASGLVRISDAFPKAEMVKTALERYTPPEGGRREEDSTGRRLKAFRMAI